VHYHVYAAVPLALATAGGAVVARRWLRRRLQRCLPAAAFRLALVLVSLPLLAMALQQWRSNLRHLRQPRDDLFLRAGRAVAAVSQPENPIVVTSTDFAVDEGVTNNFEEPKVLFHAWRRGRLLPRDRLNAANLRAALARTGARFVVVLDRALDRAAANFRAALAEFEVAAQGDGFTVLRVGS
jgi:hypothetical protein